MLNCYLCLTKINFFKKLIKWVPVQTVILKLFELEGLFNIMNFTPHFLVSTHIETHDGDYTFSVF